MVQHTCQQCGESFSAVRRDAKWCSKKCGEKDWADRHREDKRELDRLFLDQHRDEINARRRARRADDPEAARARDRKRDRSAWQKTYVIDKVVKAASDKAYRESHRDEIAVYMLDYAKANRVRFRTYGAKRKAHKLAAEGHATPEQVAARWAYYGGRCWMCGGIATSIDHVKPLAKGGSNWPANLRPACRPCNSAKKHTWPWPKAA